MTTIRLTRLSTGATLDLPGDTLEAGPSPWLLKTLERIAFHGGEARVDIDGAPVLCRIETYRERAARMEAERDELARGVRLYRATYQDAIAHGAIGRQAIDAWEREHGERLAPETNEGTGGAR